MLVFREDLIYPLERVKPALSFRESIEQGTSFVFKGGYVHAYDEKLYAAAPLPTGLKLTGAVNAKKFMAILNSLSCEKIDVANKGEKLRVQVLGKKDTLKECHDFVMDLQVKLPLDDIDEPKAWREIHESFSDALAIVQECAGKDRDLYYTTCVHVHPDRLEAIASNAGPACRYAIKTGVKKPCIIERDVIKHVVASGVEEMGETPTWLHFRSGDFRMSCRRQLDDYPNLDDVFVRKGQKVLLPASLPELVERCEKFSEDDKENNFLLVVLRPGKMKIQGDGAAGIGKGYRDCVYEGPPVEFCLHPKILKSLSDKGGEAFVGGERVFVDGGKWSFVCSVLPAPEKDR